MQSVSPLGTGTIRGAHAPPTPRDNESTLADKTIILWSKAKRRLASTWSLGLIISASAPQLPSYYCRRQRCCFCYRCDDEDVRLMMEEEEEEVDGCVVLAEK